MALLLLLSLPHGVHNIRVIGPKVAEDAVVDDAHQVAGRQQVQLVRDPHHRLVCHHLADAVLEDMHSGVLVHGTERVVQQHQLTLVVGSTCKAHTLALPTRQVHATLACQEGIAVVQHLQVKLQGAGVHHLPVLLLVIGQAEQDVVADGQVLHPRRLGHVRHSAANMHLALGQAHGLQDGLQHTALATTHAAHDGQHLALLHLQLGDDKLEVIRGGGVHQLRIDKVDLHHLGLGLGLLLIQQQVVLQAAHGGQGL
mmetsp:Transcript_12259/g.33460  ORF Transcript_12259/g.33460 Transcript_12259/m.33460 type:complete len:255 (+) Transcript_12259:3014-3778(+)